VRALDVLMGAVPHEEARRETDVALRTLPQRSCDILKKVFDKIQTVPPGAIVDNNLPSIKRAGPTALSPLPPKT
jgi:hypothetical protein